MDKAARDAVKSGKAVIFLRTEVETLDEDTPAFKETENGLELRLRIKPGNHVYVLGGGIRISGAVGPEG
jgi:hypothetical protein